MRFIKRGVVLDQRFIKRGMVWVRGSLKGVFDQEFIRGGGFGSEVP